MGSDVRNARFDNKRDSSCFFNFFNFFKGKEHGQGAKEGFGPVPTNCVLSSRRRWIYQAKHFEELPVGAFRMRRVNILFSILCCIIALYVTMDLAHCDVPADVLARCKRATAFVEVEVSDGTVSGSAFCIDNSGYFVTNNHVVEGWRPGKRLLLVFDPGSKAEKRLPATIVRQDKNGDLALLHVEPFGALQALVLGDSATLVETMEVVAFGYPFGKELSVDPNAYPSVSVSTGHITALRKFKGELGLIQLDAAINHGNSGGPLIDTHGRVIGIIVAKIKDAVSVNFAIPVNRLRTMLDRAEITLLSPNAITASKRQQVQEFTIQVAMVRNTGVGKSVELILQEENESPRAFAATSTDGQTFHVRATPSSMIAQPDARTSIIDYRIVVRQAGSVVGDRLGSLLVVDDAVPPAPAELQRRIWEARTVDVVYPGDQNSESAHHLAGENMETGEYMGRKWRFAGNGAWFAYTVKVTTKLQELVCTYWGGDIGDRTFDIQVDGVPIATQTLNNNHPGEFYEEVYTIPPSLTRGKDQVTVRFQAHAGSGAGGVFGLRITKRPVPGG
jgi:hypothetical protein